MLVGNAVYRRALCFLGQELKRRILRTTGTGQSFASAAAPKAPTKVLLPSKREEKAFVDLDTEKLIKCACINYLKDGKDPELKPDSEYPEWLWSVNTQPLPPLEELTEEEHGWVYWRELKRHYVTQQQKKRKLGIKYAAVQRNLKSI